MSAESSVRRSRDKRRAIRNACDAVLETLERRQLLSATLFWEDFNNLAWQNSREEGPQSGQGVEGENVWTNVPPAGWIKDDTGVPGYNNPDLPWDPNADPPIPAGTEDNNGITEWIGWTFAKKDWWAQTASDQQRTQFTNASGGVMVADNDEWDDAPHPAKTAGWPADMLYNAKITTPSISLTNVTGAVTIDYDSSWRPEGFDDGQNVNNQTGIINVVFSDGTTREVQHWDSDPTGAFFHDHLPNEHVTLPIGDVPAGATSFKLEFLETKSANDWWWAVDNLLVTGDKTFPGARLIGLTGNRGDANGSDPANDETLWDISFAAGPSTDAKFLDGWQTTNPAVANAILSAVGDIGVTQGSGALRVEVDQATNPFWGVRSPNVVDLLKAGATQLSYDETLIGQELNGGSFGGGTDNSFNGFAQSNELAVVIGVPSGGFIQRNFNAGGATDSLGKSAQWSGTDGTRTITWDLTKFTAANGDSLAKFITDNNATDARFWLTTQGSDPNGHVGPMRFYFDNVAVTTPAGPTTIGDFDTFSYSKILRLPFIPDTDAIGFNPDTGLLHHTSGSESYSNNPTSNGYRDNQFMETVDVVSGTNAQHVIFNANSEKFGPPGPRPTWVEPVERRTDEQIGNEFQVQGPNEYHAARDLVWSEAAKAFYVADEHGIFKLTADGQSTLIGDPALANHNVKGLAFFNVGGRRVLFATERNGADLHMIDTETAQTIGDAVTLTDVNGTPIPGLVSLAESPDGNTLLGLAKNPDAAADPLSRILVSIDPLTGQVTKLGQFTVQMADLAFVYPVATVAQVSEVYVRGSAWAPAFKTYLETHGGDDVLGYRVDDKAATDVLPWTNVDEIVLRYSAVPSGSGVPQPGTVVLHGQRGDYTVSSVTQQDPQTFVLHLNRPLGNLAAGGDNGDRIALSVPGGGPAGAAYTRTLNVLQGDVDKSGSVLAADFSAVKKKFFKSTTSAVAGNDTDYSIFHDVDGSGSILANDFSAVKARFFDNLPPAAAATQSASAASVTRELFASKRILD